MLFYIYEFEMLIINYENWILLCIQRLSIRPTLPYTMKGFLVINLTVIELSRWGSLCSIVIAKGESWKHYLWGKEISCSMCLNAHNNSLFVRYPFCFISLLSLGCELLRGKRRIIQLFTYSVGSYWVTTEYSASCVAWRHNGDYKQTFSSALLMLRIYISKKVNEIIASIP